MTAWKRILKRADVRYRKLHNTRHTFATTLFEQGVPVKTVSTLLGHSRTVITENVYINVMPQQKKNQLINLILFLRI